MLRFLFSLRLLLSPGDTGGCSPLGPASLSSDGLLLDDVDVDDDVDLGLPVLGALVDGVAAVAAGALGDDVLGVPPVALGALVVWGLLATAGAGASVGTLGFMIPVPHITNLIPIPNP